MKSERPHRVESGCVNHPPEGYGRPSWCLICGTRDGPLVRAGPQHAVFTCQHCRTEHFAGLTAPARCQSCGSSNLKFIRYIRDAEPISGLCNPCSSDLARSQALFSAGGVLFRCADCGARGTLLPEHEKAVQLRKRIPAPGVAGVTLTREHGCPMCGKALKR